MRHGNVTFEQIKRKYRYFNWLVIDHNNDIKFNGELYKSPLLFYQKNGFSICPEIRLEIPVVSA